MNMYCRDWSARALMTESLYASPQVPSSSYDPIGQARRVPSTTFSDFPEIGTSQDNSSNANAR